MANVARVNVYQINQDVMLRDAPVAIAFPTTGNILRDVSASPARSLPSGYNVYGLIISGIDGKWYYTAETISQLVTIFNA